MPAWMTSLLRDDVPVPMPSAASTTITSRPASASARAMARPTTPAPTTRQSIRSTVSIDSGLAGDPLFGRGADRPQRGAAGDHVGVERDMDQRGPPRGGRGLRRGLKGRRTVDPLARPPAIGARQRREVRIAQVAARHPPRELALL